jgi:hypothetical protein
MRHPPGAKLPHHGRLARYRELFRLLTIDAHAVTARGKRQINQFNFELVTSLVIYQGEGIMDIGLEH